MTAYLWLLRWAFLRSRPLIVMFLLIQIALGIGIIYGFAFLVPHVTPSVALFLATGAPTLSLILIGLVVVPQEGAMARVTGRQMYVSALPVPRLAPMLSEVTFWVLMQIPGGAATLLLAIVRFHIHLHVEALVVPAVALVALTAAAVGYTIASAFPPQAASQVTQFISIGLLLFSPITFPISRLPVVLRAVHHVLPVAYMADLIRGSLTGQYGVSRALAFAVVGGWCVAGLVFSGRVAARRG